MEANQEIYCYLNDLQARPNARHWRPRLMAICAIFGAIYGAAVGSTISTTTGAADLIGAVAGVAAFLLAFPGARFGCFFDMLNRVRFGRWFFGTITASAGAALGGYFGLIAVMPLGVVFLGAVGGWFVMRALLWRFFFMRLLGGFAGIVLGVCIAAMLAALQKDHSAALAGLASGVGIGAVAAPLLFSSFLGVLNLLPYTHANDRGNCLDAEFEKSDE